MKRFRRIISGWLVLVMLISALPLSTLAEEFPAGEEGSAPVAVEEQESPAPTAEVTLESTAESEGQQERICTVCAEKETEAIAKLSPPEKIAATSVEIILLDKNGNRIEEEITELTVGETLSLTAVALPENATDKTVAWSSSDESIATVDANGTVTAVTAGEATVAVVCGEVKDTFVLTVKGAPQQEETVAVTSIEITAETDCIAPGETLQLTATVLPEDATGKKVIWSSQDESVLTVDENGLVTGVASGCTFAVATVADGSEVYAQYEVVVFNESIMTEKAEILSNEKKVITYENIESAVAWGENYLSPTDSSKFHGLCAAFVFHAYNEGAGIANSSYSTANAMGDALITHIDMNPPRGALVFWYIPDNAAGHVALSLGNGNIVHAWGDKPNCVVSGTITRVNNYYGVENYRGWGSPIAGYTLETDSGNGVHINSISFDFSPNGGTGSMPAIYIVPGTYFTMPECTFSNPGYRCKHWNLKRSDNTWLSFNGEFVDLETANSTCGLYYFFSGYNHTLEESWFAEGEYTYTFYANWVEQDVEVTTEEELRTALTGNRSKIIVKGIFTLTSDLMIPDGKTIDIVNGAITVPEEVKLTNNGNLVFGHTAGTEKGILTVEGEFLNNEDIDIYFGDLVVNGTMDNSGTIWQIPPFEWNYMSTIHITGTFMNKGSINIDSPYSRIINNGVFTQESNASFSANCSVSGIANEYISAVESVNTEEKLHELLSLGYKSLQCTVTESITLTKNLTIPSNCSFFFEGSTLTIPEGIEMTVKSNGFCELSRDSMYATVDVQGELYINGNAEMWDRGTLNVSGHLVVNNWLVMQGKLNIMDGGMLTNNGSIGNYEKPVDLTVSDTAIVLNNGYIAGMSNTPDLPTEESEIWITEDVTLLEDMFVPEGTSVYIEESVTVTVPTGIELNIDGYVEVYGELIFEEGGILTTTDKYMKCLNIWTGRLDAAKADLSGIYYGSVGIQLNSSAEIVGIPNEMLYATVYVYNTEDVNAALALAPGYKYLDLMVDSAFVLMNSITIPDNTEFFIWQWDPEMDAPAVVIPGGVTVTNNGWLTVDSGYFVVEQGGKLINNSYAEVRPNATMLIYGELQQDGDFYGTYETPVDYAYKISFNKNAKDAKGTMKSVSGNLSEGGSLPVNTFTYAKKVFTGWNTKADGSGISYDDCESLANIVVQDNTNLTLYAQWRDIRYTLEFRADGITVGSVELGYNEKYKLEDFNTHKQGYHVGNWKNASNKKNYSLGTTVSKLASKEGAVVVFNANWAADTYKIAYNGNGNTALKIKNLSITHNKKFTLASGSYKYTYEGCQYEFKGWSTEPHVPSLDYTYDYVKGQAFSAAACAELTKTWTHGSTKTLYAVWGPVEYKITYKNLPSNATNSNPSMYNTVQGLNMFADLDAPGYVFNGWYSDSKYKKPISGISAGQTGAKTVYAKVTPITYKISYDLNWGTNSNKNPTSYNITQKKTLYNPTRTGYTFAGWYLENTKLSSLKANTFYGGDIVLTARWNPIAYTIKYYANDGTFAAGTATTQRVAYDDAAMLLDRSAISKAGYTLTGWNTKSTCDGKSYWISTSNLSAKSGATVKLYAMWEYPVVLHGNYDGASDHELSLYYNQSRKLTNEGYSRQGYTFKGWAISAANAAKGKVKYSNNKSVKNLTPGTELWAVWSANSVKITFNKNDGTKSPAKKTQTLKTGANLPETLFSRTDLRIVEWNTKKDGSGTAYAPHEPVANIAKKSSSSLTLYAIWKQAEGYHITFEANGGSGTMNAVTLTIGERIPKCTFTAPAGLVFAGWKINNEGDIIQNEALASALGDPNGNILECKLYAQWAKLITRDMVMDAISIAFSKFENDTYGYTAGNGVNLCAAYVLDAYGREYFGSHGSAAALMAKCNVVNDDEPPIGALVFWELSNTTFGHVGIYVGNGQVVQAWGSYEAVSIANTTAWLYPAGTAKYLGWGFPEGWSLADDAKLLTFNDIVDLAEQYPKAGGGCSHGNVKTSLTDNR